jgi:hypothetical protein
LQNVGDIAGRHSALDGLYTLACQAAGAFLFLQFTLDEKAMLDRGLIWISNRCSLQRSIGLRITRAGIVRGGSDTH